ncbi:hypothetical protein LCGC14_0975410 [marine sediment metagenome]|uniref:Uncharacterized protein n=1 Tax=marine sediment metagenome TaxID=412755 RepID=A0A0F9QTN8_9ZZZZ|nr:hypothetical protein [bacterium]
MIVAFDTTDGNMRNVYGIDHLSLALRCGQRCDDPYVQKEIIDLLVTKIGFQQIHEMQGEDRYRYFYRKEISLHLMIFNAKNKIRIESHIDVGIHKQTIQNQLTVTVLSELHALLQKKFSTISTYVKYTAKLSIKKGSPKLLI